MKFSGAILLIAALIISAMLMSGCAGTPVTLSGAYERADGSRYEAGATFTLPTKRGYAK